MLKLNASYSKKVPAEGEYSSQSYHASVEVELPDGLTSDQLNDKIHETFALVRDSVEAELHGNTPVRTPAPQNNPGPQSSPAQSRRSEIAQKTAKNAPNVLQIDRRTVYYALEDAVQGSNERKHAA